MAVTCFGTQSIERQIAPNTGSTCPPSVRVHGAHLVEKVVFRITFLARIRRQVSQIVSYFGSIINKIPFVFTTKKALKSGLVSCPSIGYPVFCRLICFPVWLCLRRSDNHFMNFPEPIRDRKKIAQIKNQLCGQQHYRDLFLLVVEINSAIPNSVLLQLPISHFLDDN